MDWTTIITNAGLLGAATWYIKHLVQSNASRQLTQFQESERAANAQVLERLKSEVSLATELKKLRFSSIYERRVNALLDVFSKIQKYEMAIGEISRDVIFNGGSRFDELLSAYEKQRLQLTTTFWCNSALFSDDLIESFREYLKMIERYDSAYRRIVKEGTKARSFSELPELEYEQSGFSDQLKAEVKQELKSV